MVALTALAVLTVLACSVAAPEGPRCNGDAGLCDRAYDEVAYVTAHNAYSILEECCFARNQVLAMPEQLARGVRGLMLDLRYHEDGVTPGVFLCHELCGLGPRLKPLSEGLAEIGGFLAANPDEVVSLILEDYVDVADVRSAFEAAGLAGLLHSQPLGLPWPTLGELIASGRRLVVFGDRSVTAATPSWYHDWRRHAVETGFSFAAPEAFSCADNRGDPSASLYILNHFITPADSFGVAADAVNRRGVLLHRALRCWAERDRFPTFVTVDYVDRGDVVEVTRMLNFMRALGVDPARAAAATAP